MNHESETNNAQQLRDKAEELKKKGVEIVAWEGDSVEQLIGDSWISSVSNENKAILIPPTARKMVKMNWGETRESVTLINARCGGQINLPRFPATPRLLLLNRKKIKRRARRSFDQTSSPLFGDVSCEKEREREREMKYAFHSRTSVNQ
jgi:hypothetical protein